MRTLLGASLSRAVCSPTPLSAACEDFDLMAGSPRLLPAAVFRVRPLRPVRPSPAGDGRARRGADTPARTWFASAPFSRGRPRLVAGRWPRVTGL